MRGDEMGVDRAGSDLPMKYIQGLITVNLNRLLK